MTISVKSLIAIPFVMFTGHSLAAPFESCPPDAFLTQGTSARAYSVNLVTGDYNIAASEHNIAYRNRKINRRMNALGFNPLDQYIYGWSYGHRTLARVHADFRVEPLDVKSKVDKDFYVGDVHPTSNEYYAYRDGKQFGLYKIDLDENSEDYLHMRRIIDGRSLSLDIADLAINPMDELGYAVTKKGELYQIDLANGSKKLLARLDVQGAFGAAYFDPDGNLYIGRNRDGHIFRIAVNTGNFAAEFFAAGPPSNINDGARCAIAPITDIIDDNVDFGDAPDSYGTMLSSNGARHTLSDTYLGSGVDGESDSSAYPLSDDANDTVDDEDGVQFATLITEGKNAVLVVKSTGSGFLNGWIDTDANGRFDGNDQILTDYRISNEKESLYVDIPDGATPGKTWARFRLSTEPGLLAYGGAPDGEVEDYQVEIHQQEVTVNHYPSATGWTTIAFEDNWPLEGDYDMNDLVVYLRTSITANENGVSQVNIEGEVAAVGAAYHNGFGIRLPGIKRALVDHSNVSYSINDKPVDWVPIESGREEAILMVTYNLWDYIGSGEHCLFYRTEEECGSSIQMTFSAKIPLTEPVDVELGGVLDPFLFATPGAWHGGHFVEAPGRGYEIHLKNQAPTEAFDVSLFDKQGDDASNQDRELYFQTENGLPWAMEIGTRWEYPIEYREISHAYPLFARYARSNGLNNPHWYDDQTSNHAYIFNN